MNFTKKIAFTFVLMILASATVLAKPIVKLSENKSDYTQTETGYILKFELDATSSELQLLEQNAASNDNCSMAVTLKHEGSYNVTFTVDHQNHPEYVHKMMLVTGFQVVEYKGQTYGLNKVIEVLKFYQDQE